MDTRIIDLEVGNHTLELEVAPDVFRPTTTTGILYQQVVIPAGSQVLDMGCGVGPLCIAAALDGAGTVYAVDVMKSACELTRRNAERNGVADKVKVSHGDLFEPIKGVLFDVIVDDVSGVAERAARISPWFPSQVPAGGPDGTGPTIRLLQDAGKHLTEDGCLYFPVLSLANAGKILTEANRLFGEGLEKLKEQRIPFCPELIEGIEELELLKKNRMIDYMSRGSRYLWTLQIFRAKLPAA